ncbi:MAG TPA: type IV toxin-antitoxin system AbiEi family antitoxin domain-containing protein, partial [Solirubrobacteraceae bacterium]
KLRGVVLRKDRPLTQTQHGLVAGALRGVAETIDRAIAAIAAGQHGLITTRQLLDLGLSKGGIAHRVKIGRLHRVYRGVYAVGHPPVSPHAHALAAVLAAGPGAVLSHDSAATLWGISKHWRTPFEVTTRFGRRRDNGPRVHRSGTLTERDVTVHFGIPVTSPARTVFDYAPRVSDAALARAVNDLRHARYLWLDDLAEVLGRHPLTRAANRLRKHLERPERLPTRSGLEDDYLLFTERYGLPEPLVNTVVEGYEVDIFYPEHRLVIELDGWETHGLRDQFELDRDRDADLLAAEIATVRITKERFDGKPAQEAERLHAILRRRQ